MKMKSIFILFPVLASQLFLPVFSSGNRKLTTYINPGCKLPECTEGVNGSFANLFYTKAVGPNDTMHYFLSSIGVPTALVIQTADSKAKLNIDWSRLLSSNKTERANSLTLTGSKIIGSYATLFTKIYEYNDTDDKADLNHYKDSSSANWTIHDFRDFTWDESALYSNVSMNTAVFNISETMRNESSNGTIYFKFQTRHGKDRNDLLPHLEYNDNITQFDFALDQYQPQYSLSRFAIEYAVITDNSKDTVEVEKLRSIDDEYSPGVFRQYNVIFRSEDKLHSPYLQYKPVCYMKAKRERSVQTASKNYMFKSTHSLNGSLEASVAYAFYGKKLFDGKNIKTSATNISFGLGTDGTYTKNNYTAWSGSLGYGTPPKDTISLLVIAIISAGLGIPVIIIVFGGIFVCLKKKREKTISYEAVTSSYPTVN